MASMHTRDIPKDIRDSPQTTEGNEEQRRAGGGGGGRRQEGKAGNQRGDRMYTGKVDGLCVRELTKELYSKWPDNGLDLSDFADRSLVWNLLT
ncbi:hypothetical protein QCA50_020914 [Cerrena zonata]|uniref:Uncharacterized protein n=1 Tax=Cerrena zonata TaxID=2478898 RepID=A0AAW0FC61_9APHY